MPLSQQFRKPWFVATVTDSRLWLADILAEGRFALCDPLPEEKDETAIADLPRLAFQCNRYNQGRLRRLVDYLNGLPEESLKGEHWFRNALAADYSHKYNPAFTFPW